MTDPTILPSCKSISYVGQNGACIFIGDNALTINKIVSGHATRTIAGVHYVSFVEMEMDGIAALAAACGYELESMDGRAMFAELSKKRHATPPQS